MNKASRTKRGFTLIELLVVIAIILLLSSIVQASLKSARLRASAVTKAQIAKTYAQAIDQYYVDNNKYPDPLGGWSQYCLGQAVGTTCFGIDSSSANAQLNDMLAPYITSKNNINDIKWVGSDGKNYGGLYYRCDRYRVNTNECYGAYINWVAEPSTTQTEGEKKCVVRNYFFENNYNGFTKCKAYFENGIQE